MKELLSLFIQLIILSVTYILGKKKTKSEQARLSYKERYDNLYSPIIELIIKYHYHCMELDVNNNKFTKKVFFIAYKNLKYIDVESMKIFQEFHSYDPLEYDYNYAFSSLIFSLLKKSINIEHRLNYPEKSKFLLNNSYLFKENN